jgi:hypothetical protein
MIIGGDRVPSLGSGQKKEKEKAKAKAKKILRGQVWPRRSLSTSGKERNAEVTEEKEPVLVPLRTLRQFPSK